MAVSLVATYQAWERLNVPPVAGAVTHQAWEYVVPGGYPGIRWMWNGTAWIRVPEYFWNGTAWVAVA